MAKSGSIGAEGGAGQLQMRRRGLCCSGCRKLTEGNRRSGACDPTQCEFGEYVKEVFQAEEETIGRSGFRKEYRKAMKSADVTLRKNLSVTADCYICSQLDAEEVACRARRDHRGVAEAKAAKNEHHNVCINKLKVPVYNSRMKSREYFQSPETAPHKHGDLTDDGATSGKVSVPYGANLAGKKPNATEHVLSVKLLVLMVAGVGLSVVALLPWLKCGVNFNLTARLMVLAAVAKVAALPRELHVQSDGGDGNWDSLNFLFFAFLIHIGVFDVVYICRYLPGHGHEVVDGTIALMALFRFGARKPGRLVNLH